MDDSRKAISTGYEIVDFDELSPVACPCGQARRAFGDVSDVPGTIHRTEITTEAKTHYHPDDEVIEELPEAEKIRNPNVEIRNK
jgi:hypothetical protein